jgi:hypothetical protein
LSTAGCRVDQGGGNITITKSDTKGLVDAILGLGFTQADVNTLTTALEE